MKYTYEGKNKMRYGRVLVTVPDQVAANADGYNLRAFPAIKADGSKVRVILTPGADSVMCENRDRATAFRKRCPCCGAMLKERVDR